MNEDDKDKLISLATKVQLSTVELLEWVADLLTEATDEAERRGYYEGFDDGREAGYEDGHDDGYLAAVAKIAGA